MKTRQNNIAYSLITALQKPLNHPLSLFIFLFIASLAITHWSKIKLQQDFWLEWSTCLSANLLAISITNFLNRKLIPKVTFTKNLKNISKAISIWMAALTFCWISLHSHESQYLALTRITTDVDVFPFLTGASLSITALTVIAQLFLLLSTITAPYRCIFTKEKI